MRQCINCPNTRLLLAVQTNERNLFSTATSSSAKRPESISYDESAALTGEECYQRALDALEKAETARMEAEAKRSEEQFQAWQKAQEAKSKGRSTKEGVAVVKTIAKQARQSPASSPQEDWEQQAQYWMEQAAFQHGHATALVRLGNSALAKANSSKQVQQAREYAAQAMEYYEMAANNGSAEGAFNLGHLLWDENLTEPQNEATRIVEKDNQKALNIFHKAIELGDLDAAFFVGVQLLSDDHEADAPIVDKYSSVTERYRAGLDLIEQAASLEHGGALYYLCLLHLNGHNELQIPPCEPGEFVERLDAAANAGDSDALFLRGHCLYHGDDGYEQDFTRALENFLAAADAGHSDAAVSAGAMLHQGVGVQRDQRRAFELYQMAGELGNVEGWRNVVACYATGEGVVQSEEMAKYIAKTVLKDK